MPVDRNAFEAEREELKEDLLDYLADDPHLLYSYDEVTEEFSEYDAFEVSEVVDTLLEDGEIEEYAVEGITHYGVALDD